MTLDKAWVGIDAGKEFHWAHVLDTSGRELLSRKVENDEADIARLIDEALSLAEEIVWALDQPGGGAALLLALLWERGQKVCYVHRRKNGGWCAQYTVYTSEGRKRKTVYGKTRAEVAVKLSKALSDREGGLFFNTGNDTLSEYLDRWLNDSVRNSVKQRTFENYAYVVQTHLIPALGHMKVKTLTPAHVQGLYRSKLDVGLSPRTVQLIHTTLHKALKQAVRLGLAARNVTESVEAPRPEKNAKTEMHPLTPEQARDLLKAACGDRFEVLYALAMTTGLRQGELFGLRWHDVDLESGTLSVRQQLIRTKADGLVFTTPKSAKGRRSVRLTPKAVQALKDHRKKQLEQKQRLSGLWRDMGLVFTSTVGTPLDPSNFTYHTFQPFLKRAGLPKIRFHDLRHTCATLLLGRNVNPKIVQEMLGHANISETMDTYSHVLPSMQETAVKAIENALS